MTPNKLAGRLHFVANMVLSDIVVADMVCGRYGRTPVSLRACRNKVFFSLQNRENSSFVRVKPGVPVPVDFLPVPDPTREKLTHTRPDPRVRVGYGYTRGYG